MTRVVTIPRGTLRGVRGTWWPTVTDGGKHCAIVTCWTCGKQRTLCDRIDPSGNVDVEYWCDPGVCSFREKIKLAGWLP